MTLQMIVCTLAILLVAGLMLVGWRLRLTGRLYWRRVCIVACLLAIGILLGVVPLKQNTASRVATNTDVIFIVDTTYSMNALDGRDGDTRLEDVKRDIKNFAEALGGSRVGIIAYDSAARIYLPLTTTVYDINSAVDTLNTPVYYYATGNPSLTNALETAKTYLDRLAETDATRSRVLVVMSDGELTGRTDTAASVDRAANNLADAADATLVIGYGTNAGGKLLAVTADIETGKLIRNDDRPMYGLVDGKYEEVISRRDETQLRALATNSGGSYVAAQDVAANPGPLLAARNAGADKQAASPENRALQQNILHVPVALAIIAWLVAFEIIGIKRLRTFVAAWRRKT